MGGLLANKSIVLTGARRGIGRAMLEKFAYEGASVWACARAYDEAFESDCAALAKKYNVRITPLYFEMTNDSQMDEAVASIRADKIPVDGLVNNAGIFHTSLFLMTDISELRTMLDVNFIAQYRFTQQILPLMVKNKKGSIVTVSSTSAIDGDSGLSAYGASKAALVPMTKAIAAEMGQWGIRANAIAPGVTQTDLISDMHDYVKQGEIDRSDLHRLGEPEDVANVATFLLSDLSSYVTGQVLRVDGGK